MWIILPQAPPTCLCNVEKLWHAVKRWMFFGQPLTGKEQYIVNWWPGAHTKANRKGHQLELEAGLFNF